MKKRFLAGLIFFALCISKISAQPYLDLGQVSYENSPGGDPKSFQHLRAQLNIPLLLKDSSIFLVNPIWDERWIRISEGSEQIHLRGFATWINYSRHISQKWSVQAAIIPRWNGEPSIQFSEGFQLGGALLMTHNVYPKFSYKFGLYYNKEFFGNYFIPLFGVDWRISKKQRLFGILPGFLTYENRIGKRFSWGGNFRTYTNSYKIVSDPQLSTRQNFIRIDDKQLGAYADIYLLPKLVLNAEAGYSVLRWIRSGYGKTSRDEYNVLSDNNAPYFRVTLQYRMRLD